MRYNLEFRKLTFYGLTRPQYIRKSKQISGQTILSSPQDAEFNPNFAKNRDIPVVKNSVTRPVTPAVDLNVSVLWESYFQQLGVALPWIIHFYQEHMLLLLNNTLSINFKPDRFYDLQF